MTREFTLSRLGLESSTPCLVYDFWEQRLLAATSGFGSTMLYYTAKVRERGL